MSWFVACLVILLPQPGSPHLKNIKETVQQKPKKPKTQIKKKTGELGLMQTAAAGASSAGREVVPAQASQAGSACHVDEFTSQVVHSCSRHQCLECSSAGLLLHA